MKVEVKSSFWAARMKLKKKSQNVWCDTGKEQSSFRCLKNIEYKCSLNNYKEVENVCSILYENRHRYIL